MMKATTMFMMSMLCIAVGCNGCFDNECSPGIQDSSRTAYGESRNSITGENVYGYLVLSFDISRLSYFKYAAMKTIRIMEFTTDLVTVFAVKAPHLCLSLTRIWFDLTYKCFSYLSPSSRASDHAIHSAMNVAARSLVRGLCFCCVHANES